MSDSTDTPSRPVTVALMGNPNAGKSSIFNALTGMHQHVGNWPGKTVEKRDGLCTHRGRTFTIVDLPGTYSLAADSPEEQIARQFLLSDEPDLVLNVVDATNLERNLYLTVQILEMGLPLVVALNMADLLKQQGATLDTDGLSQGLGGTPIVATVARRGQGMAALLDTLSIAANRLPHKVAA